MAWRWPAILFMSFALSSALVAGSFAQMDPNPRIDPGTGPGPYGETLEGWQVLTVPGLPSGATLGDVWARADGQVYVWARIPPVALGRMGPDYEGEGERIPDPPDKPALRSSQLYRFDGTQWTIMLRTPGEDGLALFGTDDGQLFASTEDAFGGAQLYRFNGAVWAREPMPAGIVGRMHTIAGVPGDLYFRVGSAILHNDGTGFRKVYDLPETETPMRGLVYVDADCQFVMGTSGTWLHHQGVWSEIPAGMAFEDVEDAWGMLDASGRVNMFAVGSDAARCGLRVWRFQETEPATHRGVWSSVLVDPVVGGFPGAGVGLHLWGVSDNEAYATGVVEGVGHLLRFDGTSWRHLTPPVPFGTVHGVWGTQQGTVWFSTESGSLVRFQRGNYPPDLANARPSVDRLWPSNLRIVPVDVLGVVDPDGDPFAIAITRITQDEPLVTDANRTACPDAAVHGNRALLRAEHADGGDGRTYDVEFTATDRLGAVSAGHMQVFVPHFIDTPVMPDPTTYDALAGCPAPAPGRRPLETAATPGGLRIRYEIEQPGVVHLAVYDVSGRLLDTVADGMMPSGTHEGWWDMARHESGVYFVKLRIRDASFVRRVSVMR